MSVTTRAAGKAQFQYLLNDVLGRAEDSKMQLALAEVGYHSVADLMGMDDEDIVALSYHNDKKVEMFLHRSDHALLKALWSFIRHCRSLGATDLLQLTADDFDDYRLDTYNGRITASPAVPSPSSTPRSLASDFKKSIK